MNTKEKMRSLRDKRYTYRQIGSIFNVSRQRVHQILCGYSSHRRKPYQPVYIKSMDGKIHDLEKLSIGIKLEGRDYYREMVRRRDNHTCQICHRVWQDGERRFDVHHIDCDSNKTQKLDHPNEFINMITLCHKCHLNIPDHREKMKRRWGKGFPT